MKKRLPQVDALRGIAAVMVVMFHYASWDYGSNGITLFFIISGFVILVSIAGKANLAGFAWARFVRLYPLFWAAMALTCAALLLAGKGAQLNGPKILANMTMAPLLIRSFAGPIGSPAWIRLEDLDYSYWTLIYELFFYALAGLTCLVLRVRRPEWPCLIWLAAALVERVVHPITGPWDVFPQTATRFAECFVLGVVIFQISRGRASSLTGVVAAAALAVSCLDEHGGWAGAYPMVVAAATVAVWLAAIGVLRPLAMQPFPFLGRISYALYLVHQTIGEIIQTALSAHGIDGGLNFTLRCAVAVGLASTLTFLVERPAHNALIGLFGPPRTARSAA